MMPALTLVSHDLCPYVQRAAVALAEKGVPFERVTIDLADKPDWFRRISPLGKVPLLRVGETVIFESAVILEYLEETQPNPLLPADPLARARHRAMIEFGSAILGDIWVLETTPARETFAARLGELEARFARLENEIAGPWFAGARFGLVDAVFGPVFRYFDVLDRALDRDIFANTPKVAAWRAALAARPSVRDAVVPDYGARLERFILRQNGHLAQTLGRKVA